jgi:hypothetical protein
VKLEFFYTFSKTSLNIKFHQSGPVGVELFHVGKWVGGWMDGWMDGYEEANSHFSQFCESA